MITQAVKDRVECGKCGCIALPDATKCPKCGSSYHGNGSKTIIDAINYLPNICIEDMKVQMVRAHYQIVCPHHGRVNVKASVIASTIKCPFCSQRG